ncbi:hypothetical protein NW768_010129 [Fusarium equiseti]|uniref:Uncharacterized protein n=1 Tax=Fusarium equiseti TaxID=61235 RepID=A0ABQ8R1I4_FUSEQ|nr:hypothetical protein NW768_010129 [Fusarium equiseti]
MSDFDRVFTDSEEEIRSLFTKSEQITLEKGQVDRSIIEKVLKMTFRDYQWESMFRFFEAFMSTIWGWHTPNVSRQFQVLKNYAAEINYDYYMEDKALEKKQNAIEITASGDIFKGDDLIALYTFNGDDLIAF